MSELRDAVGVILRAPVVAALTILWVCTIWPVIVGFSFLALILQPLVYPFAFTGVWLHHAFLGKKGDVLPDYWKNYPDEHLNAMNTGFPTLRKWLLEGFEE